MKIEEKFVETKFGKINYLEIGEGKKTLVYIHGWVGNPIPAIKIAHRLNTKDYRVIAPYLPGHGDSFDLNPNFTFKNLLETFEDFFNKLGLKNVVGIGHSVGGVTVYELANSGKKLINKAVIIDGYNNFRHDGIIKLLPLVWAVIRESGLWHSMIHTSCYRLIRKIKIKKVRPSALFLEESLLKTMNPSVFNSKSIPMENYLFVWGKRDCLTPEKEWIKQTGIDTNRVVEFAGGHCWCTLHLNRTWPVMNKFLMD